MTGIIILGTKPVEREVGSGSFSCPSCGRDAPFSRVRVRQVFTLYFVPLFPLGSGRDVVRCRRCGAESADDVVAAGSDETRAARGPWRCAGCGNTNPPEYSHCVACGRSREP